MPCDWEGKCESGVALAMPHRLCWFIHLPHLHSSRSTAHFSFTAGVCVWQGLRGAVSFALSLHLNLETHETRQIIVTTTLIIVIFTILFLGGSTMPLMKVTFTHNICITTHTHNRLTALCLGLSGSASTRRNIHPLTSVRRKKKANTHTHTHI